MNSETTRNESLDPETHAQPRRVKRPFIKRVAFRLLLLPVIAVAGLFFLSMTSSPPENLGVQSGRLAPCPDSPNCVSSQATDPEQSLPPIGRIGTREEFIEKIKSLVVLEYPNAKLITETDRYLHFEFTSRIFRFVDDVEFLFDDKEPLVHFRSASRVGHSDLGVNRRRMKRISERLSG